MSIEQQAQTATPPPVTQPLGVIAEPQISEAITARKTQATKPAHPHINSPDPALYPFPAVALVKDENGAVTNWNTGVPSDYSSDVHAPLVKKDFKDSWQYYQYKADKTKAQHAVYIEQRNEAQSMGNKTNQAAIKRLKAMQKNMALITQQLLADGIEIPEGITLQFDALNTAIAAE